MGKGETKITIAEAIEQGFKYFCEDGGETMLKLSDYVGKGTPEPPSEQCYWLIGVTPHHYSISPKEIEEVLIDYALNQEEFGDEDGELADIVAELHEEKPELFNQLSEAINEKYKKKSFLMPTNIQVIS